MEKKHLIIKIIKKGLIFVLLYILISTINILFFTPKGVGHFKNLESKELYTKYYEEILSKMPEPSWKGKVETKWGMVMVYKWDAENEKGNKPILLIPGHSAGVTMWSYNLPYLRKNHTVYAFDALGDSGLSIQSVPFNNNKDVSNYIIEVIDALKIDKVNLMGHSFGGGTSLEFAIDYKDRINSLVLIEPAFGLSNIPPKAMFGGIVSSISFLPKGVKNWGTSLLTGEDPKQISDENDSLALMINVAIENYSTQVPNPKVYSKEELGKISFPVYLAIGSKSPISGQNVLEKVKAIQKQESKIYEGATHSLPMVVPEKLDNDLQKFWEKYK